MTRTPSYYARWIRPLSPVEKAMTVMQGENGGANLVRVVRLPMELDEAEVRAAVDHWQAHNARLQQTYMKRTGRWWLCACDENVPVGVVTQGSLQKIVEAELNDDSWRPGQALVRVLIASEPRGGDTTALVFGFHHIVGDGRAVSWMIDQLVARLIDRNEARPEYDQAGAVSWKSAALMDLIRDFIGLAGYVLQTVRRRRRHGAHAELAELGRDSQAVGEHGSGIVSTSIGEQAVEGLRKQAKSLGVGVTVLLAACLLRAISEFIPKGQRQRPTAMTITREVDTPRGYMRPSLNVSGLFLHGPSSEELADGDRSAIDLARSLGEQQRQREDEHEPLWATKLQGVALRTAGRRPIATVGLSNLGFVDLPNLAKVPAGYEMWGGTAVHGLHTSLTLFTATTAGGTYASFVFDRSVLARATVQDIADRWLKELAEVVGNASAPAGT